MLGWRGRKTIPTTEMSLPHPILAVRVEPTSHVVTWVTATLAHYIWLLDLQKLFAKKYVIVQQVRPENSYPNWVLLKLKWPSIVLECILNFINLRGCLHETWITFSAGLGFFVKQTSSQQNSHTKIQTLSLSLKKYCNNTEMKYIQDDMFCFWNYVKSIWNCIIYDDVFCFINS